ncbi:LysM peptidoglycan-binding domain-containing protein [Pontibacter fetidus]|uniref:LysM peptidoglycan-binding domain-containing protein n=1 Tax=Pontibacter fetidus TaxID=2700082 RepID=A0A6B2H309_9BACT|nr:LysM peptidoglycan-binding domain-containing protein [Pontibacter fetidus]NDK57699.1 LysM peptidoglycan-binding domain-containing protein [Pontibacter fetidus]
MRQLSTLLILLFLPLFVWAQQAVTVPKNVYFADIHLTISDGAQQELQKKVDALQKHPAYFQAKVELADAYFPLIDQIFKEEGVPADLKYLSLQESGLIGDAVSTSNAVGYWQFKREAASDFNLRIDNVIDERKHIMEASRGAAKYFKRSNSYYNNWFNSILSYYLGYSGAKAETKTSDIGAKKMEVTEKTHPYLLTFLAHKIAYENFVGKTTKPAIALQPLRATPGQSLAEIALDNKADFAELEKYNKWLLGSTIPSDKAYYVMLPVRGQERVLMASNETTSKLPAGTGKQSGTAAAMVVTRNGLNALVARQGDTKDKLALQAGISTRKLLKYNDLRSFDNIEAGTAYYTEPKHSSASAAEFHVVQPGETMQMISQHYGIRLKHLVFKNRMKNNEVPLPGRVLWLQKRRPFTTPVEVRSLNKQTAAKQEMAASEVKPATKPDAKKENFFTRFVNSFKKNKKQPAPVKTEAPAQEEELIKVEVVEGVQDIEPATETVLVEEQPVQPPVTREAIYPGRRTPAKPAATTAKQETAPVKTAPAKTEQVKTAPAKPATTTTKAEPVKTTPAQASTEADEEGWKPATTSTTSKISTTTTATPVSSVPATKSAKHVVAKGETLYGISKMYNVTVAELTTWNKLPEGPLKLGQELIIAEPLTATEIQEVDVTAVEVEEAQETNPTGGYHTVVAGETLYQISKKYNVTLDELKQWNNLADNAIKLGQELQVVASPTGTPAKTQQAPATQEAPVQTITADTYHTVEAGESMYQISRKYGVTIKDIMDWNKKADFNVKPGEKLLIKKKN